VVPEPDGFAGVAEVAGLAGAADLAMGLLAGESGLGCIAVAVVTKG